MAKNNKAAEAKAKAEAEAKAKAAAAAEASKVGQGDDDANTRSDGEGKSPEGAAAQQNTAGAAAQSKPAEKPGAVRKVPALSVTSKRDGFRRGGRAWSKTATVVKLSELSKEEIAQIKGEALLEVEEVEVDEVVE